ncbi:MAG: hypothetical protein JKX76_11580 [Colwellia sp.]|nr:hypothetical protein [Colwellia sp.]
MSIPVKPLHSPNPIDHRLSCAPMLDGLIDTYYLYFIAAWCAYGVLGFVKCLIFCYFGFM